jgi:hypothetical protein
MLSAPLVSAGVWSGYQLVARGSDLADEKTITLNIKDTFISLILVTVNDSI